MLVGDNKNLEKTLDARQTNLVSRALKRIGGFQFDNPSLLKEHVALDRSRSLKSVCNCLL